MRVCVGERRSRNYLARNPEFCNRSCCEPICVCLSSWVIMDIIDRTANLVVSNQHQQTVPTIPRGKPSRRPRSSDERSFFRDAKPTSRVCSSDRQHSFLRSPFKNSPILIGEARKYIQHVRALESCQTNNISKKSTAGLISFPVLPHPKLLLIISCHHLRKMSEVCCNSI